MVFAGTGRFGVDECDAKHVSTPSKRVYMGQAKLFFLLDGRSRNRSETKSSKGCPAIGKFMIEAKAATEPTPESLRVVTPKVDEIVPVSLAGRTGGPTHLSSFHIFSVNQRFDARLLGAFRVYGHSVEVNMPGSLELTRSPTSIGSIRGEREITVASSI
jgi:hypothetical protein